MSRRRKGLAEGLPGWLVWHGLGVLLTRYGFGWSWDKIWRHYGAWFVIWYAAGLALVWLLGAAVFVTSHPGLSIPAFVALMAVLSVRQHRRRP